MKYLIFNFLLSLYALITFSYALTPPTPAGAPPKSIYHFGSRKYLSIDIAAKTIPLFDWNTYVIGSKTKFGIPPYRRGLYGTNTPGEAVAYGDDVVGSGEVPWFINIQIRDQCLVKPAILDYSPDTLYADQRFEKYLKSVSLNLDNITEQCYPIYKAGLSNPKDWFRSSKLSAYNNTKKRTENECEIIVHQFLDHEKIKVIKDDAWANSWIIRDRNCIKTISGTTSDILNIMAKNKSFWSQKSLGLPLSEEEDADLLEVGMSYTVILPVALLETPRNVRVQIAASVAKNILLGDPNLKYFYLAHSIANSVSQCADHPEKFEQLVSEWVSLSKRSEMSSGDYFKKHAQYWYDKFLRACKKSK